MILFQESVSQPQTGILLRACAEAFSVEIKIPFLLTKTKYDNKTFAYYVTGCWNKNLWKCMSLPKLNSCLDIVKDF